MCEWNFSSGVVLRSYLCVNLRCGVAWQPPLSQRNLNGTQVSRSRIKEPLMHPCVLEHHLDRQKIGKWVVLNRVPLQTKFWWKMGLNELHPASLQTPIAIFGAITIGDSQDTETLGYFKVAGTPMGSCVLSYIGPQGQLLLCAGANTRTVIAWPTTFYWYICTQVDRSNEP